MTRIFAFPILVFLTFSASAASSPYVGRWGISADECSDDQGPNSNIAVTESEFHLYENHCRITQRNSSDRINVLGVRCTFDGTENGAVYITMIDKQSMAVVFAGKAFGKSRGEIYKKCIPNRPKR